MIEYLRMKRARYFALVALAPFMAWCADLSADPAFARYRSIIDRMPFGEPPPNFDPTLAPGSAAAAAAAPAAAEGGMTEEQRTEEEQKLASSVRVSVLNVTPAGRTMVGFTDSSTKPPEHYYLPVGGERDGWSVKAADPVAEKVTLAKGEVEVTLKLGEGSTGNAKDVKQKSNAPHAPLRNLRSTGLMGANLSGGPMGGQAQAAGEPPGGAGALARLRERRVRQKQAEEDKLRAAAAEQKAEDERRAAEARAVAEQAAAEREQQRATLMQIQEELRRQNEEKNKQRLEQQEQEG